MMGPKRKFADYQAGPPSRNDTNERPSKRSTQTKNKAQPNVQSSQWVKKRVRTIERRFRSGQNMPADVQDNMERELAHHKQALGQRADDKRRNKMITKYHMVRFHERKKADRLAKQLQRQLDVATDPEEVKRLKAGLHIAEVDSLYARYFPFREPYTSLYPATSPGPRVERAEKPGDGSSAARALDSPRPPLWVVIEKAAKEGKSALVSIQERKAAHGHKPAQESDAKTALASNPAASRRGRGAEKQQDSSDNEGGFFEEE
ncbi:hypothetical protein GGR56DRAFT_627851 [Xylariaceae sp. FL0804]|nr:hypothetical protein GGR56DRAFT_627851 [Xylariaceae sp. FL0804]